MLKMERGAERAIGRSTSRVVDMDELKRARERRASSARHPSEQYREERQDPRRDPPREREQPMRRAGGRQQPIDDDTPFWNRENPFEEQDRPFWQQQDRPFRGMEDDSGEQEAPEDKPRRGERQKPAQETARPASRAGRASARQPERPPERKPAVYSSARGGRAGLKAFFIMLALFAVAAVIGLKVFEIKAVDVKGADTMTPESVIALSGISRGQNIFQVNLSQARKNLESDPLVEVLGISRAFPDRIKIDIRQRKPHGAMTWLGGYVIIDEKGFALDVRDSLPAGQYPLVTGVEIKPAERGKPVEGIAGETMGIMQKLLTALYDEKATQYISEVNLADTDKLLLLTAEGLQIDLGKPADLDVKAKWIASAVPELRKQGYTNGVLYVTGVNSPVYSAAVTGTGDASSDDTGSAGDNSGDAGEGQEEQAGEGDNGGPDNAA